MLAFFVISFIPLFWFTVLLAALYLVGLRPAQELPIEWLQYWYAFIGAVFGSLLTLSGAHLATQKKKEKALAGLISVIEHNDNLLKEVRKWIGGGRKSNFVLDTVAIDIWLTKTDDLLGEAVVKEVNDFRYQLDHINTKLSIYYHASAITDFTPIGSTADACLKRQLTLLCHTGRARIWAKRLLGRLKAL